MTTIFHCSIARARGCALVGALAFATASSSACEGAGAKGRPGGPPAGDGKDSAPLQVETTRLQPARIERHYRTSGTLQAVRAAEIVATDVAVIVSVGVEEGQRVEAGDIIARLDGRERALTAAAATLQAENLARELDRLEGASNGVISTEEIDKQRYAVQEARVSARLSKHQAKQTVVRAPFAGTIVERLVDPGNLATTATPLVRLADLSSLELDLHLPERDAATVKVGSEVDVELVDASHFTASVVRKAPIVDALTGTVKFTVAATTFPPTAMPGAFARAEVLVDARDAAPSIERSAVFEVEAEPHVYVVADGKAHRKPIELGLEGLERVEIRSGLEAEDVVVRGGNAGITEGMPLQRAPAESPTSVESS